MRALSGDRARERGAEKRADAPIHLIKRLQELGAGKYALFTYSLSPFIFFVAKKEKTGKIGQKKEKERKRKEVYPASDSTSNARKDKYERRNMNENDFSAAFDAEDAFASRMDYMRRRRRRRRREVEKEEEEEEEKVRRQRASEPRRTCFVLDKTQKITRNSRSHLGQGLVKYCSKCEAFARSANASLEKITANPETRKAGRVANRGAKKV